MIEQKPKKRYLMFLFAGILLLTGFYFVLSPFLAGFIDVGNWNLRADTTSGYHYISKAAVAAVTKGKIQPTALQPAPKQNTLVIPSIGVDYHVLEGKSENVLNKGLWHRPKTSTPDKGGNTVIAGHRYQYISGPHTLFNLDKVKVGDQMIIFWNGQEYDYEVTETKVVPPTAIEIERNTSASILTVYSCTPVFTTKDRLVVIGKLITTAVGKNP